MAEPIRNYADDPEIRERAAQVANQAIREATNQRTDLERQWRDANYLWQRKSISDVFPPEDVRHVNEPFNRAEALVPRIYQGVYGMEPWFLAEAEKEANQKYEAIIYELMMWYSSQGDWQFYGDQEDGIRRMIIEGTVFYKTDWWDKKVRVADRPIKTKKIRTPDGEVVAEKDEPGNLEITERNIARPRAKSLEITNVYVDRYADSLEECRYIGDKSTATIADIKRGAAEGRYTNIEDLVRLRGRKKPLRGTIPDAFREVWLYEIWTWLDLPGLGETPVAITIAETKGPNSRNRKPMRTAKTVIAIYENTFPGGLRPYVVGRYIKGKNEIYGVGALIPISSSSKDLDDWRTLSFQSLELAVMPPFISTDASEIEGEQMFLWPGKVLHSPGGPEGLQAINMNVNQGAIAQVENVLRRDIGQTTRTPDAFMGGSEAGRQTAYEVRSRMAETGTTLSQIVRRYRHEVTKPILRNWLALAGMHFDEDTIIRKAGRNAVTKNPFLKISPSDIQRQFDFKILDAPEIAMMGNRARDFVNWMRALPQQWTMAVKYDQIMVAVLKSMGIQEAAKYIHIEPDPESLMSAAEEDYYLSVKNQEPEVQEGDNHIYHKGTHMAFKGTPQYEKMTAQQKASLDSHIAEHDKRLARMVEKYLQSAQESAVTGRPVNAEARGQHGGRRGALRPETPTSALQRAAGQTQGA